MAATAVHGDELTASLPGQVTDAIAEVLPSNDPLDRADFNPIDFINAQFPTEVTMDRLEVGKEHQPSLTRHPPPTTHHNQPT